MKVKNKYLLKQISFRVSTYLFFYFHSSGYSVLRSIKKSGIMKGSQDNAMEVRKVFPSAVPFLQRNFGKKVVYNWFEVLWYRSAFCWKYLMSFKIVGPRPWYILSKKEILWFLINNYCFQLVSLSNWGRDPPNLPL